MTAASMAPNDRFVCPENDGVAKIWDDEPLLAVAGRQPRALLLHSLTRLATYLALGLEPEIQIAASWATVLLP